MTQQDIAAIRDEIRRESLGERARDRIEARAASRFANPEDAVVLLGNRASEFVSGDAVDTAGIDEALSELLSARPYLAAGHTAPTPSTVADEQGFATIAGRRVPQWSESTLKQLAREHRHEDIERGRIAGNLNRVLHIPDTQN